MEYQRQVLAVSYGGRVGRRSEIFLNFHRYDEPDAAVEVDCAFWVIRDAAGTVVVDTGFTAEVAARRGRRHYGTPADLLPLLGVDPGEVTAVVATHAHWDHIGNIAQFPRAQLVMTEAEYGFWTSALARRFLFAAETEPPDIAELEARRRADQVTLFTGQLTLAPGIELTEVGGHTPGQLIVSAATAGGTAVLASDALHLYEEVERDRPFAIVADLPGMYRAYDTLAQLAAQPRTHLVAGHDPRVHDRFAPFALPGPLPGSARVTDVTRPAG